MKRSAARILACTAFTCDMAFEDQHKKLRECCIENLNVIGQTLEEDQYEKRKLRCIWTDYSNNTLLEIEELSDGTTEGETGDNEKMENICMVSNKDKNAHQSKNSNISINVEKQNNNKNDDANALELKSKEKEISSEEKVGPQSSAHAHIVSLRLNQEMIAKQAVFAVDNVNLSATKTKESRCTQDNDIATISSGLPAVIPSVLIRQSLIPSQCSAACFENAYPHDSAAIASSPHSKKRNGEAIVCDYNLESTYIHFLRMLALGLEQPLLDTLRDLVKDLNGSVTVYGGHISSENGVKLDKHDSEHKSTTSVKSYHEIFKCIKQQVTQEDNIPLINPAPSLYDVKPKPRPALISDVLRVVMVADHASDCVDILKRLGARIDYQEHAQPEQFSVSH